MKFSLFAVVLSAMVGQSTAVDYYLDGCCSADTYSDSVPDLYCANAVGDTFQAGVDGCYNCDPNCDCCARDLGTGEGGSINRRLEEHCKRGCPCFEDDGSCNAINLNQGDGRALRGESNNHRKLDSSDQDCAVCTDSRVCYSFTAHFIRRLEVKQAADDAHRHLQSNRKFCYEEGCCTDSSLTLDNWDGVTYKQDCIVGCPCCFGDERDPPFCAQCEDEKVGGDSGDEDSGDEGDGRSGAGVGGDPHVKTWSGDFFDFHGQCDLALLSAPSFANNTGLTIQIRTEGRHGYSFIKDAAVVIGHKETGGDVFQVSSWSQYMINGVSEATLPFDLAGQFTLSFEQKDVNHAIFTIDLGEEQTMELKVFKDWISISFNNVLAKNFQDSVGLMGAFGTGAMVGRDGTTIFTDPNEFGQEWQVLESEPMLFSIERPPQHPHQACIMPDPNVAEGRRRLGETIDEEAAEIACAHHDEAHKELCIYDVMVSGDIDVAQAGAF